MVVQSRDREERVRKDVGEPLSRYVPDVNLLARPHHLPYECGLSEMGGSDQANGLHILFTQLR